MFKRLFVIIIFIAMLVIVFNRPLKMPYKLAFATDQNGQGDIVIVDQWGRVSNLIASPAGEWDPTWTNDGKMLAFTGYADNQADIWLAGANGQNLTNLSHHPAWDYSPAWSPDGSYITFVSERDGDPEIFIQALSGGQAQQLTFNEHFDKLPNWSADGQKIAFASIINGREQIYLLNLAAENNITPLLQTDLSGTGPVWHPSQNALAFIGWEDSATIGIYTYNLDTQNLETLYTDTAWLGSLNWSADGRWLFFTARPQNNHDIMALNLASRDLYRLTNSSAWEDFPALRPGETFQPPAYQKVTAKPSTAAPRSPTEFGYGVNLADLGNAYLIQDIHFNAIKGYINWATIETEPGQYRWTDPDNILHAAQGARANVLLRIHGTPPFARPANTPESHPPTDSAAFARFLTALATRYQGRVMAYEIWNEPNLYYEWGYRQPSPAEYTDMLKIAYPAIKAGDPNALVISAGLAPTGKGSPPEVWGDLAFTEGLYQAGAKGYFDALGNHAYTYGLAPDDPAPADLSFNRVAEHHAIMEKYGDASPVWITEMGWNIETNWDLGEYHNQGLSQAEQARYLSLAYQKINADWPWVKAAYLFNLDFSLAPWYNAAEQMRWYAILNPDRTPRPAYSSLGQLEKK